ncbi:MAG: membrane protein insertion efficiency factor YidD [Desulfosarcina sp.]
MKIPYLVSVFCLFVGCASTPPLDPIPTMVAGGQPAVAAPIRLFQDYLSGADGHRCPMSPSCSAYALRAMQRHGTLRGWIMACDRLMRCGHDELKHSQPVRTPHGFRSLDPVGNNDFWWSKDPLASP